VLNNGDVSIESIPSFFFEINIFRIKDRCESAKAVLASFVADEQEFSIKSIGSSSG